MGSLRAASKLALATVTEGLAAGVAPFGIRVALVEPGFTRSGVTAAFETSRGELESLPPTADRELERSVTAFSHRMTAHRTPFIEPTGSVADSGGSCGPQTAPPSPSPGW